MEEVGRGWDRRIQICTEGVVESGLVASPRQSIGRSDLDGVRLACEECFALD